VFRRKSQENVLKAAVRNVCVVFTTMVDIRRGCLVATNQSSHACDTRHTDHLKFSLAMSISHKYYVCI
jgi:hypothetical protein